MKTALIKGKVDSKAKPYQFQLPHSVSGCLALKSAKLAEKASRRVRSQRRRTGSVRRQPGLDAGRTLATDAAVPPLAQLLETLERNQVKFLIAGVSAAVLQGVPYTTLDTDIWINLPYPDLLD